MGWPAAFALTLIIELPLMLFLLRGLPVYRIISYGLLMNLVSHTLLWFVFPQIFPRNYFIFLGELAVISIEFIFLSFFFPKEDRKRLLLVALMINFMSFLVGEMLNESQFLCAGC